MIKPPSVAELKKQCENSSGAEKAVALSNLGRVLQSKDPKQAEALASQAHAMALELNDPKALSLALNLRSDLKFTSGLYHDALKLSHEALQLQKDLDDPILLVRTYTQIANNSLRLNRNQDSLSWYEKALRIHKSQKNQSGIALVLSNIALIHKQQGEYAASLEVGEQARKLYRRLGNRAGEARSLGNNGTVLFDQGLIIQSTKVHLEALKIREEIGDKEGMAHSLGCIGIGYLEQLKNDQALEYLTRALDISKQLGNHYYIAHYLTDLAGIYSERKDFENSLGFSLEALEHARVGGMTSIEIHSLVRIANICDEMGDVEAGLGYAEQALEKSAQYDETTSLPRALLLKATFHFKLGATEEAKTAVLEALELATQHDMLPEQVMAHKKLSLIMKQIGNFEKALEAFERYAALRDQIQDMERDEKVSALETRFTAEKAKQQMEIYRLKNVNLKKKNQTIEKQRAALAKSSEEYRELAEQLGDSNGMKELLLDIITHDLKNPAGTILGFSDLALKEYPDDPMIAAIHSSSARRLSVLESTTVLTQSALGESIPKQPLNLNQVLEEVVTDMEPQIQSVGMDVSYALEPDLVVEANPILAEIFKNYLSNALKYSAEGGRILISGQKLDEQVKICVCDWGETIPEADRERIFERQFQMQGHKRRGGGLGLAIVKRLADAHGGRVWVEPNQPQGNKFCLQIPIAENL